MSLVERGHPDAVGSRGKAMKGTHTAVINGPAPGGSAGSRKVPGVNCQEASEAELLEITLREALAFNRQEASFN